MLALAAARPVTAPELQAVASGPAGTLIAAGRLAGQPVVHLAFDLLESNLPLEVAWPVFTANAVAWLAGSPAVAPVTAGAEIDLALPADVTGVEVTPPAGDPVRLDAVSPRLRVDQVGVWTPRWLGPAEVVAAAPPPAPIAVNAVPEEGDLSRPGPPADGAGAGGTAAGAATSATGRRVTGSGILVAVLVFLLAEWAAAHGVRPLRWLRRRRAGRVGRATSARRSPRPQPAKDEPAARNRVNV
jgi:hypothetical protein